MYSEDVRPIPPHVISGALYGRVAGGAAHVSSGREVDLDHGHHNHIEGGEEHQGSHESEGQDRCRVVVARLRHGAQGRTPWSTRGWELPVGKTILLEIGYIKIDV